MREIQTMNQERVPPRANDSRLTSISRFPIEVRPTLLIGVGGTGTYIVQWTYTLIRRLLGAVPPFIKFLALDTDAQEEGKADKLPPQDFFNLFHHFELGEVIRDFERAPSLHAHLSWLKGMRLDPAVVSRGCQGLSRLGRIVFFELRDSIIRREIVRRFDELNSMNLAREIAAFEPKNQFELPAGSSPIIHLAGSLCGGTGTGLLLDLAYNLRDWANETFHRRADIMAHLVLPDAFPVDAERIRVKLQAVALAMLEQIELLTDGRRGDLVVQYRNGVYKTYDKLRSPFDHCFLVSGKGPAGGDHRDNLAQMIGMMLRALTVEPISKAIYSDANNKKTDILGHMDTSNHRKLFLASYGLHCGTPGTMRDGAQMVKHWICDTLSDLPATSSEPPAEWNSYIEQTLRSHLGLEELANQMPPLESLTWEAPLSGTDYLKALRPALDKHLKEQASKQSQEAARILPAAPAADLCKLAKDMVKNQLLNHPRNAGAVAACLDLWREHLQRERDKEQKTPPVPVDAVLNKLREAVLKELQPENLGQQLDTMPAPDICSRVDKVLEDQRLKLGLVLIRGQRAKVLEQTHTWFDERVRGLRDLARAATQIDPRVGSDQVFHTSNGEPFSTPLFNLVSPTKLIQPGEEDRKERKMDLALVEQFHQQLINPLVEQFAFREGTTEIQQTRVQLQGALDKLSGRMETFLDEYQDYERRQFYLAGSPSDSSPHHFAEPLRKIITGSTAKIAVDQNRRSADTLDVTFAQHPDGSCIPDLLRTEVGQSYWSATVSQAFQERTKNWVQLMQYRYGFCLEALDSYHDYQVATRSYLEHTKYNPEDLWLDPTWYGAFHRQLGEWQQSAAAAQESQTPAAVGRTVAGLKTELEDIHQSFFKLLDDLIANAPFSSSKSQLDCYRHFAQERQGNSQAIRDWPAASRDDVRQLGDRLMRQAADLTDHVSRVEPALTPQVQDCMEKLRHNYDAWLQRGGFVVARWDGQGPHRKDGSNGAAKTIEPETPPMSRQSMP
jgi:hypothetical protein